MSKPRTKLALYSRIKQRLATIRKSFDLSQHSGVLLVLLFVGIYGTFRILSPQTEATQVRFIETAVGESYPGTLPAESQIKNPFSGPEYDAARRLRETSAMGMAISLSVLSLNTRTGRLPNKVTEIIQNLGTARLLPPGVQFSNGTFASEQSTFHIAYRRDPFSFEVLAIPRSDQGSQLLFRFPLPQSEPNSVLYFEANREQPMPLPLLSTEQLSASGWNIRHWRGDALTLNSATLESLREQTSLLGSL